MGSKPPAKLSDKQQLFVHEYLKDLNGTRAARRAGYAESSSHNEAYRLLRTPAIHAAIKKKMADRARRVDVSADRVLREYQRIAFADIRRVAHWNGSDGVTLKEPKDISDDDAAAIAEVSSSGRDKVHRSKLKLHDKKRALDAIARHIGLFGKRKLTGESPAETAERVRDLIRARLAHLGEPEGEG